MGRRQETAPLSYSRQSRADTRECISIVIAKLIAVSDSNGNSSLRFGEGSRAKLTGALVPSEKITFSWLRLISWVRVLLRLLDNSWNTSRVPQLHAVVSYV